MPVAIDLLTNPNSEIRIPKSTIRNPQSEILMPFPQLGIENIPQTLAEKVEGKYDYEYGYSRNKGEPWGIEEIVFSIREDIAPGGVGRWHAKT